MNDCYLNLLVSFRALFSADPGANLVNSKKLLVSFYPIYRCLDMRSLWKVSVLDCL